MFILSSRDSEQVDQWGQICYNPTTTDDDDEDDIGEVIVNESTQFLVAKHIAKHCSCCSLLKMNAPS